MDSDDRVRDPLSALRSQGSQRFIDSNQQRARTSFDCRWGGIFFDVPAHHRPADVAGDDWRLDHLGIDIYPRVQPIDFSLQPRFGTAGALVVLLLFGCGLRPHGGHRLGGFGDLHRSDRDRTEDISLEYEVKF